MFNSKALVTGGSGFIGTNLVCRLKQLGFEVLSLDIAEPRNASNIDVHRICDVCDLKALRETAIEFNPDYLFHLAARTDLRGKSLDDYSANIVGVDNVCSVLSQLSSVKHAVFASSMLVCKAGHIPSSMEDVSPATIYGQSKVEGECIVRKWRGRLSICSVIRPTSIWGPWFSEPYRNFFDVVLSNKYIRIGERSSTKTYGYVDNCVNQIISISQSSKAIEYCYIGDTDPVNVDEWSMEIALLSKSKKPLRAPMVFFYLLAFVGDVCGFFGLNFPFSSFRLKNMTTNNIVDCSLADKLNCYSKVSRLEGIRNTLRWLKI